MTSTAASTEKFEINPEEYPGIATHLETYLTRIMKILPFFEDEELQRDIENLAEYLPSLIQRSDDITEDEFVEEVIGLTNLDAIVLVLEDHFIEPISDCPPYVWESVDPTAWFNHLYVTVREQLDRGLARQGIEIDCSKKCMIISGESANLPILTPGNL